MSAELLTEFTEVVTFDRYEDIREALFNANLSRSFDKRSYHDGNIRDGVVSISHGGVHRARRRVENTQFRPDVLRLYEHDLFPGVMERLLDRVVEGEEADLYALGEVLSVVLASRRAGIEFDPEDLEQLRRLVHIVDVFSQGSAILDAKDPDAVRDLVRETYLEFDRDFLRPAWNRRQELLDRVAAGNLPEADLPHDILTVLLQHRADPNLELGDDGRVIREVATYLQGGTHTSGQTVVNCFDLIFATDDPDGILDRLATDLLYAQRAVHETLRLRPTTPKIKRRAEADTTVAGRTIPKDAQVVLDAAAANQDPRFFGANPSAFDPDRDVAEGVSRWGLSFGAGAHQCPGRSVAGGFPVPDSFDVDDQHVFGLVALMLRAFARRGIRPDPEHAPERDTRTERFTRWRHYPVRFTKAASISAS
ncbi:MAG TPA: cytochrome P450 [Candidatus Limnocylindrales bacterium]